MKKKIYAFILIPVCDCCVIILYNFSEYQKDNSISPRIKKCSHKAAFFMLFLFIFTIVSVYLIKL